MTMTSTSTLGYGNGVNQHSSVPATYTSSGHNQNQIPDPVRAEVQKGAFEFYAANTGTCLGIRKLLEEQQAARRQRQLANSSPNVAKPEQPIAQSEFESGSDGEEDLIDLEQSGNTRVATTSLESKVEIPQEEVDIVEAIQGIDTASHDSVVRDHSPSSSSTPGIPGGTVVEAVQDAVKSDIRTVAPSPPSPQRELEYTTSSVNQFSLDRISRGTSTSSSSVEKTSDRDTPSLVAASGSYHHQGITNQDQTQKLTRADWLTNESRAQKMLGFVSDLITSFSAQNNEQDFEIERLSREKETLLAENETLRRKSSMLEEHSRVLEDKLRDAEANERKVRDLLQQAHTATADLQRDVALVSLNALESTKDDQYFSSKFTEVFLSVQSWVLQHYRHCSPELVNLNFSEALEKLLAKILGNNWSSVLWEDHIAVIEALVHRVLKDHIFDPGLLRLVGKSIVDLQSWMVDSSQESRVQWRLQTIRMITSKKDFPQCVAQRVLEVTNLIDQILSPFARVGSRGIARNTRLRGIIENAAKLAVEAQQQPSRFKFIIYPRNRLCNAAMTDASGRVADEEIAENGGYNLFTISPAVYRVYFENSGEVEDTAVEVALVKARIVRAEQREKKKKREGSL